MGLGDSPRGTQSRSGNDGRSAQTAIRFRRRITPMPAKPRAKIARVAGSATGIAASYRKLSISGLTQHAALVESTTSQIVTSPSTVNGANMACGMIRLSVNRIPQV